MILNDTKNAIESSGPARHKAVLEVARFYHKMHPIHREKINESTIIERLGLSENEWLSLFEELTDKKDKERIKNNLSREARIFIDTFEQDPFGAFQRLTENGSKILQGYEKRKLTSAAEELQDILNELRSENEGMPLLDHSSLNWVKIQPVDLVIVGARSGVGKTTLALNITEHFLKMRKRVLYVSYEVNRGRILARLLAIKRQEKYHDILKSLRENTLSIEKEAKEFLRPLSVISDPALTVEELTRLIGKHQEKNPLDLVIVDYDQLCATEKVFEIEERRVAYISQKLKGITLTHNVPVILLSQLSKEGYLRYSQQKLFDSSIALILKVPKDQEDSPEYWKKSKRELIIDIVKYREGQPRRDIEISIDFETGALDSEPPIKY